MNQVYYNDNGIKTSKFTGLDKESDDASTSGGSDASTSSGSNPSTGSGSGTDWEGVAEHGLDTISDVLKEWFKSKQNITNYYNTGDGKKDNTMLYVGIGGGVLLLLIILIVALKK